ncbi:MAG: Fur family transcriptional regulator [Anaerolineales bacterium]|nr:Fur family transcriptional regulator [Anaerolineales bacterium]
MSCTSRLSQTLRSRGFRMTPQRLAILQALHDGGHLSPAQVYERVRQTGLTEATIYRTLEFLAENGVVLVANRGNGHLAYELKGESHHHLICRNCRAQVDIEPALLENAISQMESKTGYRLDAGHLTFFGLCPACQPNSQ